MKEFNQQKRKEYWEKYIRYRWEFTRRNKDYQLEYEDLVNTADEDKRYSKKLKMVKKWSFAVNPNIEKPFFIEMGYGIPGNLKIIKSPLVDYIVDEGLLTIIGLGNDPHVIDNELIISVDINGPDWLTISSLEHIIKSIRNVIEINERKISWEYFDDYLKIYDLSEAGLSNKEIATKVFLKNLPEDASDFEDALESSLRKVRRYLKIARELVKSGQII